MPIPAVLSIAAAYLSLILSAAVVLRDRRSFVHRVFAAGMFLLAVEELLRGIGYRAVLPEDVIYWQKRVIAVSALIPVVWLAFSVTYARVNFRCFLSRWKWILAAVGVLPIAFVEIFRKVLFTGQTFLQGAGRWLIPFGW